MSQIKILVCDQYTVESLQELKTELPARIDICGLQPTAAELADAQALLIRSRTPINAKTLDLAPNLKVIVTSTSGYDHIDLSAAQARNVKVMYTPDANSQSAAELTLLLMLATLRRAGESDRALRDGKWKDHFPPGSELCGKTVGIIGLGRVGGKVARFVQSFGARPVAFDPYQSDSVFLDLKITRMGLTEVLSQADIISMHIPLTEETRRMIRQETIEAAQEGVVFINTSRGKVVDESALVQALTSGHIAAAGLDVYEHEPLARESKLRKMSNVVLTPHIGAYTEQAFRRASFDAAQKVIAFFKDGKISDNLPPQ